MTLASAATVTTEETLSECRIAIHSLRMFHPGLPIFVACSTEFVKDSLSDLGVVAVLAPLHTPSGVLAHNSYHRPDAILNKMVIMREALRSHSNVLLFDADIVFQSQVQVTNAELMLSLNLSLTPDMNRTAGKFGLFNAGLLWTSSKKFVDWWESEYQSPTHQNAFYEQTALGLAPSRFTTDYFPLSHNHGFWRNVPRNPVRSFHVHLGDDIELTEHIRKGTMNLRPHVWSKMNPEVARFARSELGHPRKIFFIHFGKAAGVYVNQSFKRVLTGYQILDSWTPPYSMARDWSEAELRSHITSSKEFLYLHQHQSNITGEDVELAKSCGWTTFTFYRDPKAIIASFYFFAKQTIEAKGRVLFMGEPRSSVGTFDEYFEEVTTTKKHLWELPDWVDGLDHAKVFSDQALDDVMMAILGHPHIKGEPLNASRNPGWEKVLGDHHIQRLEGMPEYQRSMNWISSHG